MSDSAEMWTPKLNHHWIVQPKACGACADGHYHDNVTGKSKIVIAIKLHLGSEKYTRNVPVCLVMNYNN